MRTTVWNDPLRGLRAHWVVAVGFVALGVTMWQTTAVWLENRAISAAFERSRRERVTRGDVIDTVVGIGVDASRTKYQIAGHSSGSLVLAMSVDCGFCGKNGPVWEQLAGKARLAGVQVVWVSRDTLERVRGETQLDRGLVADPNHSTYIGLKLSLVPQTLVVARDGVVLDTHAGVIDGRTADRLASAIASVAVR